MVTPCGSAMGLEDRARSHRSGSQPEPADPVGVLRGGLLGQALLVTGVALAAAGVAWSEQILRAAVPR